MVEGLRRAGKNPTREGLVDAMEKMNDVDLGGFYVSYSPKNHAGSKFVDLTIIAPRRQVPALSGSKHQAKSQRDSHGNQARSEMLSGRAAARQAAGGRQLQILIGALVLLLAVDAAVVLVRRAAGHVRHDLHRHRRQDPHAVAAPRQGGAAGLAGQPRSLQAAAREPRRVRRADEPAALRREVGRRRRCRPTSAARAPGARRARRGMEEERAQRGAGHRRGAQPARARASAVRPINDGNPALQELADEVAALSVQSRRLGAAKRHRRAAHDAHAAHGEERQHHARRGADRPRGLVPARQGRQQFPRHAAGPAAGQRGAAHPARRRRGAARQARRDGRRLQGVPARGAPTSSATSSGWWTPSAPPSTCSTTARGCCGRRSS